MKKYHRHLIGLYGCLIFLDACISSTGTQKSFSMWAVCVWILIICGAFFVCVHGKHFQPSWTAALCTKLISWIKNLFSFIKSNERMELRNLFDGFARHEEKRSDKIDKILAAMGELAANKDVLNKLGTLLSDFKQALKEEMTEQANFKQIETDTAFIKSAIETFKINKVELQELQGKIAEKTEEINTLKVSWNEIEAKEAATDTEIKLLKQQIEGNSTALNQLATLRSQITVLETKNADLKQQFDLQVKQNMVLSQQEAAFKTKEGDLMQQIDQVKIEKDAAFKIREGDLMQQIDQVKIEKDAAFNIQKKEWENAESKRNKKWEELKDDYTKIITDKEALLKERDAAIETVQKERDKYKGQLDELLKNPRSEYVSADVQVAIDTLTKQLKLETHRANTANKDVANLQLQAANLAIELQQYKNKEKLELEAASKKQQPINPSNTQEWNVSNRNSGTGTNYTNDPFGRTYSSVVVLYAENPVSANGMRFIPSKIRNDKTQRKTFYRIIEDSNDKNSGILDLVDDDITLHGAFGNPSTYLTACEHVGVGRKEDVIQVTVGSVRKEKNDWIVIKKIEIKYKGGTI